MAAQTRGTFSALYDNVDKMIIFITDDKLRELPEIYSEIFSVKGSTKKFERSQSVVPFGDVPQKDEGDVYAFDLIRPGYQRDVTHVEFGLGFEYTETADEDDEFDVLAKKAELLAYVARVTQEKQAAAIFNNGFSTQTTPDGQALFSTAHVLKGGGTAKNSPSSAADLTITSLSQAFIDMQTDTKDEAGHLLAPITSVKLHIPPALEFIAERLVSSAGLPGSSDNDINAVKKRRRIDIVVNPYLSDTDAWFLVAADKNAHGFLSYKRVAPKMAPMMADAYTGNKIAKIRFRQSWDAILWQGSYGTAGA